MNKDSDMLIVEIIESSNTVLLQPTDKLTQSDFEAATRIIDPYIKNSGKLNGIIIHVKTFPWWDSFSAFISHLKFVGDHHKKISHVAIVTDSVIGLIGEHIASHFVVAEIKHFSLDELDKAKQWASD